MSIQESVENKLITQLIDEDKVNQLLIDFNFNKPNTILEVYIKDMFKDEEELYKNNISNKNPDKLFIEKYKSYEESFNNLNQKEKRKYKILLENEKTQFERKINIIKKYIFKGADGKIKLKRTAFQIYLGDEIIKALERGESLKNIMEQSYYNWYKLDFESKKQYSIKAEIEQNILDIAHNFRLINSFVVFIYHYLKSNKFTDENFPNLNDLAKIFNNLPKNKQLLYEDYTNEFINLRFKLYDIYEAIHGINTKTPAGALRIFLQEKAYKNEINSIKEGKNLWKHLSTDEKEIYLSKCHSQFLAYKYKELLINKNINRFLPKKPKSPFTIFLRDQSGVKVPDDTKTMDYFHNLFNNLSPQRKEKYNNMFKKEYEDYNKKLYLLNNKIFGLPSKPKSGLYFYVQERFKEYNQNEMDIDCNEYINLVFEEWSNNKIDKQKYLDLAKNDKKRFEIQVNEFETHGYYSKFYEEDIDFSSSCIFSSSSSSYTESENNSEQSGI